MSKLSLHYGFCPLVKLTFKDLAKLTAFAAIFKTKSYFRWDIWGSLFIQFHFFHIFDSPFTFSWVLIISDKLQWPRKGSWGTSWILPSKSGSKYFLKNIMTENIWKIFAPWRGPHLKWLFSTFFKSRSIWLTHKISELPGDPFMFFANISANIGHIWSKKYLAYSFGSCLSCKKGFNNFPWKLKSQY